MNQPLRVQIADRQQRLAFDRAQLEQAVGTVLVGEGFGSGEVSVAVVTDAEMRDLHRRFMEIDEPTDVLTFPLEQGDGYLEGEVVTSADTAAENAVRWSWPAENELLLYVIHGCLHLAGYDDQNVQQRAEMRARERHYLLAMGIEPPAETHEAASAAHRQDHQP